MADQELKDLVAQNAISIVKLGERIEEMRRSHDKDFTEIRIS